ncbi:MAG: MFS transporter [Pseudomonadota bacterium]
MSVTSPALGEERASLRFIALSAFLVSTVALGIDMMLASLPEIGVALSPADPARATLVMGSFFIALGVSTLFVGPLLDALGRRPVILGGLGLYMLGGFVSWTAPTLEVMLAGRALMGVGAAAPRIGVQAIIRDRFEGRKMAATVSLVMMIFTLVPGIAPLLGAWIEALLGWRAVFAVFPIFGAVGLIWFALQQPETLRTRRPFSPRSWGAQIMACLRLPVFRRAAAIQLFVFASLYGFLTAGPAIFTERFGIGDLYHYLFGAASITGAFASFVNARLVERLGMVRLLRASLVAYGLVVGLSLLGLVVGLGLPAFFVAMFSGFFVLGFVIGNAQALGLQPLPDAAGTGSATLQAVSTLGAGALAIPIPLLFTGSAEAMVTAQLLFGAVALWSALLLTPD